VESDHSVCLTGRTIVRSRTEFNLARIEWPRSALAIGLLFGGLATSAVAQNQVSVGRADARTTGPCSWIVQGVGGNLTQNVNCIIQGFNAEQMAEMVRAANEGAIAPLARQIEDLRGRLGVTEGAALAMLRSLGQADVPPERLPQALADLAQQHRDLLDRLRAGHATWARWRVLWVDDNPRNNEFERQAFEEQGVEFALATSTSEARRILDRSKFDAIISDMGRPPDSEAGYTLLSTVRSNGNRIPYFIYAGSRDPRHVTEALSRGAQGSTNLATELIGLVLTSFAATTHTAPADR
jgi:CheY-like chemotaxis protein